jgi:hypothetical protein
MRKLTDAELKVVSGGNIVIEAEANSELVSHQSNTQVAETENNLPPTTTSTQHTSPFAILGLGIKTTG